MSISAWVLASRPKTLSAAVAPVAVGTALAYADHRDVLWAYAAAALAGALLIQIATNFINDALDFKRGADTSARLGPTRVTQAGLLSYNTVLRGAYLCLFAAAMCGIPLIARGGWPLLVIGVASMAAAYAYTGGPYPLAYHGLGELFVLIFFGLVAVGGTYYVLSLRYNAAAALAGVAVGALGVVILAINNLRDIPTDRESQKRTVAVRLGENGARAEIALFVVMPYLLVAILSWLRSQHFLWLCALSLPLAILLLRDVYLYRGRELNRCLAMAGAFQWLFSALFCVGLVV